VCLDCGVPQRPARILAEQAGLSLTAVDAVAAPFLAANGGPIVTCNLDNELSYIAKDAMFACDYNACVIGPGGYWPQWLARTYGQPSELPYVGRYSDFDAVPPPRELGDDVQTNLQWYLDWVRCKESLLADYVRLMRDRNVQESVHLELIEAAVADVDAGLDLVDRRVRRSANDTRGRVSSIECPLRPSQDLDVRDVEERRELSRRRIQVDVVDDDRDGR